MVINEYTDDFKENKLDFLKDLYGNSAAPILSIRDSEFVIPYGGTLVLNYHVCQYYGDNYPEEDVSTGLPVIVGKEGIDTFTTVVRIDEDVLPLDEVPEFKQTTLRGEQVIEIELPENVNNPGMHSIIVYTISDGISSPVEWLKFRIEDENESSIIEANTIDLSDMSDGDGFTSEYENIGGSYINADSGEVVSIPGNCSNKVIWPDDYTLKTSAYLPALRVVVARYTVTKVNDSTIKIEVDDGGKIYYFNTNAWIGDYRTSGGSQEKGPWCYGPLQTFNIKSEDISGTYYLTDDVTINGSIVQISSYIDHIDPNTIPNEVRITAVKNRIALTRLCEAVQAHFYGDTTNAGKCKLILPEHMNIGMDYHGLNYENSSTDSNAIKLSGSLTTDSNMRNCASTKLPDRFILDLNKSVIFTLQVNDIEKDPIFTILDCYDTHVINGSVHGSYKYRDYATLAVESSSIDSNTGSSPLAESLCNTRITGSEFCSFSDMSIKYSVGYDGECTGRNSVCRSARYNSNRSSCVWRLPFNQPGYIDTNGKIHKLDYYVDDDSETNNTIVNSLVIPRYTKGFSGSAEKGYTFDSTMHKIKDIEGVASYRGRVSFISGVMQMHGGYNFAISKATGESAFSTGGSLYIYFYKKFDPNSEHYNQYLLDKQNNNGQEPDYEPLEFIKAYKILPNVPFLVPKDAEYAHMCCVGTGMLNKWRGLAAYGSSNPEYHGQFRLWQHLGSWCCGYKNCTFSDCRTSIGNFQFVYQCYMKNCYTSNMASGRMVNWGGFSNQGYNIDTEDNSHYLGLYTIKNFECISGSTLSRLHHPRTVHFENIRNYSFELEKNVFWGAIKNSYVTIKNKHAYSHPIKFLQWDNDIFRNLTLSVDGNGVDYGIMMLNNCDVVASSSTATNGASAHIVNKITV